MPLKVKAAPGTSWILADDTSTLLHPVTAPAADSAGDRLELHVRHEGGREQTLSIPPSAAAAVAAHLTHMLRGERGAVLAPKARN